MVKVNSLKAIESIKASAEEAVNKHLVSKAKELKGELMEAEKDLEEVLFESIKTSADARLKEKDSKLKEAEGEIVRMQIELNFSKESSQIALSNATSLKAANGLLETQLKNSRQELERTQGGSICLSVKSSDLEKKSKNDAATIKRLGLEVDSLQELASKSKRLQD